MKFIEIARFLNISEEVVRSLAKRRAIPGRLCGTEWQSSLQEIENWYIGLSGREWSALVGNGRVEPLVARVAFENAIALDKLLAALNSWEQQGRITIVSTNLKSSVNPKIVVRLVEAVDRGQKVVELLKKSEYNGIGQRTCHQIELAGNCERTLGTKSIIVVLLNNKTIQFTIEDDMAEILQRDREIIRFYLACYLERLSIELHGEQ